MMSYKSVDEWLGEEENFSMRGERLIEQFGIDDVDDQDALVGWLQVAWNLGAKSAEATLRAYADMLGRQTVDREAVTKVIEDIIYYGPPPESPEPYVDRILALMPASDISPPAMSESGAVSTNNPNVAHMNHAKDGKSGDE